jgi:N utilization substance protein A
MEVPEIHDGLVKVKAVAREAGSRTKIAVTSTDEKIDCVGSCVGVRGQRVKSIVRELGGEKIDIIRYSDDVETYIKNAMAPAELKKITLNSERQSAEILVEDDQLSLAIGKKGQNVRLASKLIGWELDVRSASQKVSLSSLDGVGEKTEQILKEAGIQGIRELLKRTVEELSEIPGIGAKTAEKVLASAKEAATKKSPAGKMTDKTISEEVPEAEAAAEETKEKAPEEEKGREEAGA